MPFAPVIKFGGATFAGPNFPPPISNLTPLTMPAGAEWFTDNYQIFSNNTTDFDPDIYKKDSGVTYYVAADGSDGNNGLTPETAFATPAKARQQVCDRIIFAPGRYPKAFWDTASAAVDGISHICEGGVAEFLASNLDDSASFEPDTRSGVYRWTGFTDTCYSVWDESVDNGFGGWGWLFPQVSADDVETNGGWYVDTAADILYVKLDDSRAPDSDVRVNTQRRCYPGKSNGFEFYEGINFHGAHVQANPMGSNMILCFKNCNFGYSSARDASNLDIVGNTEAYVWHCDSYSAYLDCFGYRGSSEVVEIGCNAYDTRIGGSNNASSSHDAGKVIRIADGQGQYHDTVGDTVADVNSGISFNIGIRSWSDSFGNGRSDYNYTAVAGVGMYLINCSNTGHTGQYAIEGNGPKFWQQTEQNITGPIINAQPTEVELYPNPAQQAQTNQGPTSSFTHETDGLQVTFTDTSSDPDGSIVSRLYDFGDGNTSTEQNPTHEFSTTGNHTVTLTVTDDDGAENASQQTVSVYDPVGDDSFSTLSNEPLIISESNVLANDSGWGQGALSVSIKTQPSNGTVIDNADGTWLYAPNLDYIGSDSFTVTVTDGSNSKDSTVNISVLDASALPTVTAVSFETAGTPTDGELVTLDVTNAGTQPLNDSGNHAPLIFVLGETYLKEGVSVNVDESGFDPEPTPGAGDLDTKTHASERYLGNDNAIALSASDFDGSGGSTAPLFSPVAATPARYSGHLAPTAVIKGQGNKCMIGALRGSSVMPEDRGKMIRPASVTLGSEHLYSSFRLSVKVDPTSYLALDVGSDPSGIFSEGDSALVDITGGDNVGSQLDAVVIGVNGTYLHLSVQQYTGYDDTSVIRVESATPSTGIAKRNNPGDSLDYASVSMSWVTAVKYASTKMMRYRTYLDQNNIANGTNLFMGSLTHDQTYVGFLGPYASNPKAFWQQRGKEGLDKTSLVETVYMRDGVSRFYLDGVLLAEHASDAHDLAADAHPRTSQWGNHASSNSTEHARLNEYRWSEMVESISPARILIANHGDITQATHTELQYIDDWQRTEAGKIKFNLRQGELLDLSDVWVFIHDHNDNRNQYGFNLLTGAQYDPTQATTRNVIQTTGNGDYFYVGTAWTSPTNVWFVEQDLNLGDTPGIVYLHADNSSTSELFIQADGTVRFDRNDGDTLTSTENLLALFDSGWWRVRTWSDGVDSGVIATRWEDDMSGLSATVELVTFTGGAGTVKVSYLQRFSSSHSAALIANVNINDEHLFSPIGPTNSHVQDLVGGNELRHISMNDTQNLIEDTVAPPVLG